MKALSYTTLAFFFALLSFSTMAQQSSIPPLVSVSGQGEVKVQPDQITFMTGVEVREKTLEEARKVADQRTAALIAYLKKSGVEEKNIQTAYLYLQPIYNGEYGQTTPQFYLANRTVTVILTKVQGFDALLEGLYKAGANRVDGISFQSTQLKKHQDEARKKAIQDAKQKATMLAAELGAKVGRPYQINEGGANAPGPVFAKMARQELSMDSGGGSTLALGQITITSSVDVSFILE
ncbi:SIMPL domain-containing protein [Rufibacter sp. LB8]|uniref:SIMPL domain-containing protein n=1 Tax=Rufibacter sp. LB8 TaxID=2777781 RepID=UPI00178C35FC|nr:SIMPL domain-containing protein [Rufibacter sp. LB8]